MANHEHLRILKQGVKAWNQWRKKNEDLAPNLSRANLNRANLTEADMRGVNLSWAKLVDATLTTVNLSHAKLYRANLSWANLTSADLNLVDLGWANLADSNLTEANLTQAGLAVAKLSGANLKFANLTEAILTETDFTGAELTGVNLVKGICSRTILSNVDLSEVHGLETIQHDGPSYIDIHTLYKSKGKIPEIFLRGCGVPEDFITFLPSLTGKAIEFYSCFISYSHADKAFARRVHDTLQGRGIRCWLDEREMNPGDDIYVEVDRGIRLWDKVLLCASQHSLTSWWVDNELDTLFEKERRLMKDSSEKILALIPLDLDGYLFSADYNSGKKRQIRSRLVANFKDWEHDNALFEREIERVVKALRTDGGKAPPPEPKLKPKGS